MTEDLSTVRDAAAHAVEPAEAFAEKVFTAALGCMETFSLYLGEQTGWIAALTEGPLSAPELARRTGTAERYALEWLEMQAVYGNLVLHSPSTERRERRFALAPGAAEVLHDRRSLGYLGALPRLLAAVAGQLDRLHTAYRDGGGVSWAQFGDHARTAQADLNRPWFEQALAPALASVPALHAILDHPGARFVDVGCGAGWSSIALAQAYPAATVLGMDIDEPSVQLALARRRCWTR